MKRRTVLTGLGISTLAASLTPRMLRTAQAGAGSPEPEMLELLFVQSARAASLANGKLTLSDVHGSTLFFTDRPERITGHEPTEDFVYNWNKGEDSFAEVPPNATLVPNPRRLSSSSRTRGSPGLPSRTMLKCWTGTRARAVVHHRCLSTRSDGRRRRDRWPVCTAATGGDAFEPRDRGLANCGSPRKKSCNELTNSCRVTSKRFADLGAYRRCLPENYS